MFNMGIKTDDPFFKSLISERDTLQARIDRDSIIINISPLYKEMTTPEKRLMCLKREFMQAYLLALQMLIEEIHKNE